MTIEQALDELQARSIAELGTSNHDAAVAKLGAVGWLRAQLRGDDQ